MKRILLLLVGFISSLCIWADTTYTISFNGSDSQSTADYFSKSGNHNFNTKFTGATYAGISFTSGLKMEGSTLVGFTNANTATVVIVQSTWSDKTIKFDGAELSVSSATEGTGCRVYTIENVSAAIHKIERGSGESGLFYVSVTEATATSPTVKTMPLSATYALGTPAATPLTVEVTMVDEDNDELHYQWFYNTANSVDGGTAITGATSKSYTPDITAVGTLYYYCVITEVDASDTQVGKPAVTNTVAIEVISSVEAPVFSEFNGTVELDCATTSAVLYYSLDDGVTWIEYTHPFTVLDNDVNVQAKAQVGGGTLTSEISSHNVVAVKKKEGSSSITLYYNTTDMTSGENGEGAANAALIGNTGTDYEDWSIEIANALDGNKTISSGNSVNGKSTIKNSNGRQMLITMPAGVVANRITLYSYVNVADATAKKNYWSEIAGTVYGENSIAMASFSDASNPDIRVYALDDIEDELTFNNNGVNQLCFYAVIDYTVAIGSTTLNSEGFATLSSEHNVHVSGAQAYTCTFDGTLIDAQPITSNVVPAYNGVLLYGEPGATVTLNYQKTAEALGSNDLKATTTAGGLATLEGALVLSGSVFKSFTGAAFDADKAYLPYSGGVAPAKGIVIRGILDEEGEATGFATIEAEENTANEVKKSIKDGRLIIETANGVFTMAGARIK